MHNKIAIVLIGTNSYYTLAHRFIRKWQKYFVPGHPEESYCFFLFTDETEEQTETLKMFHVEHSSWVDATNSKFKSIFSLEKVLNEEKFTHCYYFDADTNIKRYFRSDWFIGSLVGGEHYNNRWNQPKPYDRNPQSAAFIPENTTLPQIYYYGAFFGGTVRNMMAMVSDCYAMQLLDQSKGYEPAVNDESYINRYFHTRMPTLIVKTEEFEFVISDKGGMADTRAAQNKNVQLRQAVKEWKGDFDIVNGSFVKLSLFDE